MTDPIEDTESEDLESSDAVDPSDDDAAEGGGVDASAAADAADDPPPDAIEVADLISDLEQVTAQRDEYLDLARRVQAEFENYKRRVEAQRIEQTERAAEQIVVEILPVLDACEAALAHGADDVAPVHSALYGTLEKRGLNKVDAVDVVFDPVVHEAVLTEPGDGDDDPVVIEVMRSGYSWNGRVVRPAMVKVRG